jgi:membrane associated rhomboid family serine protease
VHCADYSAASAASVSNTTGTGVFILLLLNLIIFVLDHTLHLPQIQRLYLDHLAPRWWQFLTSSFCHASWAHLSSNTFLLYVFGKIVEEEEGIWGVWFTYIITAVGETQTATRLVVACMSYPHMTAFGYISRAAWCFKMPRNCSTVDVCARAGASVASYLLQPKATISLGASGAVFGLFAVSVLVKLSFNLKKLIECGILGQFVIKQLLQVCAMIDCLTVTPVLYITKGVCAS